MIVDDWRDVLGEGLVVHLELPIAPSDRIPTTHEAAARLLDAVAVLEDGSQGYAKEEPPSPELQRLESKIDLLTDLVSFLLSDRIPRRAWVWISGEGLVLPASLTRPGANRIELYPSQWLARPLVLELGEWVHRDDLAGAIWRSPDPLFREALGRWVFRLHRREVARRRMSGEGPRGETKVSARRAADPFRDFDGREGKPLR
ncbi:PilZ domain-containing protein [Thiocystis violacea]|uniref:PilZ domain-containing protein n=1 Tax=Thiocystis violacea TaxID=13725 RepID=UPI0019083C00|nr:PilZ domain-containing protein [Thiocystis violacea]MBK1716698.1 hypothetical protein [Thiocystis violacea]